MAQPINNKNNPSTANVIDPQDSITQQLTTNVADNSLPLELQSIVQARHHDPFSILGRHPQNDSELLRVFIPGARDVFIVDIDVQMERIANSDIFECVEEWH